MLKGNGWVKVKKNNFMDFLCENKYLSVRGSIQNTGRFMKVQIHE